MNLSRVKKKVKDNYFKWYCLLSRSSPAITQMAIDLNKGRIKKAGQCVKCGSDDIEHVFH